VLLEMAPSGAGSTPTSSAMNAMYGDRIAALIAFCGQHHTADLHRNQ
jgi:hypothetical protein